MDKELIGHTIIENKTYAVGNDKKGLYLVKDNSIELIDPNFKINDIELVHLEVMLKVLSEVQS